MSRKLRKPTITRPFFITSKMYQLDKIGINVPTEFIEPGLWALMVLIQLLSVLFCIIIMISCQLSLKIM